MKFNENHRRRYILINNIVVTQATIKLYSMTVPIPFLIIGPGCSVYKPFKPNAREGIYTNFICNIGQHVRLGGGGGGRESHRWGTFTIWYFIRGGGEPCDTGFNSPTEKVAENILIWEKKN